MWHDRWQDVRWRALAKSSRPILVGPWRSELGFETLYWLPWLAQWRHRYGISRERVTAITRGGAGAWYDAARSVDLYDYVPVAKVRQAMLRDSAASGSIKQQASTDWEAKLLPFIAQDLGLRRYVVLHPSLMYRGLTPWFNGQMGQTELLTHLRYTDVPVPAPPLSLPLPEKFVAVKFYHRHTWPMNDEIKGWVVNAVANVAKLIPVVLLESGLYADDHVDFPLSGPNITSLAGHVTPQNNLAMQSAVLAKATAFMGTYGGCQQLAVRLKKPSAGFYAKFEGTCYAHKIMTEWLAVQLGVPCFIGTPNDARFVKEILG